jgi:hypothetical protein
MVDHRVGHVRYWQAPGRVRTWGLTGRVVAVSAGPLLRLLLILGGIDEALRCRGGCLFVREEAGKSGLAVCPPRPSREMVHTHLLFLGDSSGPRGSLYRWLGLPMDWPGVPGKMRC